VCCFARVNDDRRTCEGSLLEFEDDLAISCRGLQPKGGGGKLSMATLVVTPSDSMRVKFDLGLREKCTALSSSSTLPVETLSDDI